MRIFPRQMGLGCGRHPAVRTGGEGISAAQTGPCAAASAIGNGGSLGRGEEGSRDLPCAFSVSPMLLSQHRGQNCYIFVMRSVASLS